MKPLCFCFPLVSSRLRSVFLVHTSGLRDAATPNGAQCSESSECSLCYECSEKGINTLFPVAQKPTQPPRRVKARQCRLKQTVLSRTRPSSLTMALSASCLSLAPSFSICLFVPLVENSRSSAADDEPSHPQPPAVKQASKPPGDRKFGADFHYSE